MHILTIYGDELYHHGIIGQKWGLRRFQNKDGTWTAEGKARRGKYDIAKGSSVYRISTKENEPVDSNRKYVSTTEKGSKPWKEMMVREAKRGIDFYSTLYKYEYKAVKDIKVADYETAEKTWRDMCQKNPEYLKQSVNDIYTVQYYTGNYEGMMRVSTEGADWDDFSRTLGWRGKSAEKFFDALKDQDYGAVRDYYGNTTNARKTKDAVIILDPEKFVEKVSSVKIYDKYQS